MMFFFNCVLFFSLALPWAIAFGLSDVNNIQITNYTPQVSEDFIDSHLHNFYFVYYPSSVEINYKPSGDEKRIVVEPFKTTCIDNSCSETYFDSYMFLPRDANTLKMDVQLYEYSGDLTTRKFDGIRVHIDGFYNGTIGYSINRGLKVYPDYSTGSVNVEYFNTTEFFDAFD